MTKLHIGCGSTKLKDYVNIDIKKTRATDRVLSCLDLPSYYDPNSIDEIYSCHMIEHMTKRDGENFLSICSQLLTTGGVLRLEFPGVDRILSYGSKMPVPEQELINNLYGMQRDSYDHHQYGYTKKTMTALLERNSFFNLEWSEGRTGYGNSWNGWKVKGVRV